MIFSLGSANWFVLTGSSILACKLLPVRSKKKQIRGEEEQHAAYPTGCMFDIFT